MITNQDNADCALFEFVLDKTEKPFRRRPEFCLNLVAARFCPKIAGKSAEQESRTVPGRGACARLPRRNKVFAIEAPAIDLPGPATTSRSRTARQWRRTAANSALTQCPALRAIVRKNTALPRDQMISDLGTGSTRLRPAYAFPYAPGFQSVKCGAAIIQPTPGDIGAGRQGQPSSRRKPRKNLARAGRSLM